MSGLSLAYIFHHQQLLVDQNLQLPKVEKLASDLLFTHDEQVIARDLLAEEHIPEGLQLVPIRQHYQLVERTVLQASRAVQLLEWRRNHSFVATVDIRQKFTQPNMQWYALLVATTNILV